MLAYRTTWIIKQGRMQEALETISAELGRGNMAEIEGGLAARVYTPNIGPNVLIYEEVWEDAAAHDAFWGTYDRNAPEVAPFWAKWGDVTERSIGSERWNVAEWR
jgi:quinol monooxygenase YgiN